jgi:hypothetical protein
MGRGWLYVEVRPSGAKLWRVKYRYDGKEKLVALGEFPALSLTAAKSAAQEVKDQRAAGKDPAELRKTQRAVGRSRTRAEARPGRYVAP